MKDNPRDDGGKKIQDRSKIMVKTVTNLENSSRNTVSIVAYVA